MMIKVMTYFKNLLFALLVLNVVLIGCNKPNEPTFDDAGILATVSNSEPSRSIIDACGSEIQVNLLANQNMDAGNVSYYNDSEILYVCITMDKEWVLKSSRVFVGIGEPSRYEESKFANRKEHGLGIENYCYEFALNDIGSDAVIIALHANVKGAPGTNNDDAEAWAGGALTGKGWSMTNTYEVQKCITSCTISTGANVEPQICGAKLDIENPEQYSITYRVETNTGDLIKGSDDFDGIAEGDYATIKYIITNSSGCVEEITKEINLCN